VVFAALILGLLWLLHRGVALEIILHVMCLLSLIYLLNAARLSGGVFSLRLLWLMVIPVMSYYVMGPRSGLVWMIVTGLSTATMGVLTLNGVGVEIPAINPQQHLYAFATISVNCLTLLMVPYVYDRQHRLSLAESQRRQSELEQTRIELEHTKTLREHFISAVSHELRTPMNAILGFNSLLLARSADKPRAKQLLEHNRQ
jgi:signal transduction histidine kinase